MQTVSEAAVDGFYYKPRVTSTICAATARDLSQLGLHRRHHPQDHRPRRHASAHQWAETFRDTFDPADFYIEIQEHGITTDNGLTDEQMDRTLIDIAKQWCQGHRTNDFHYLAATTRRCRTSSCASV